MKKKELATFFALMQSDGVWQIPNSTKTFPSAWKRDFQPLRIDKECDKFPITKSYKYTPFSEKKEKKESFFFININGILT